MQMLFPLLLAIATVCILAGCQAESPRTRRLDSPGGHQAEPQRELAQAKHEQAVELIEAGQLQAAEQALREALEADVTFGPAHNNLGKVYFEQGKLYEAAWRFEYAIELMPDQPEPHNNLGLVMEAARRLDAAIEHYEQAHELAPENVEILGNLVRSRLRRGDRGDEVRRQLQDLVLKDTRPEWVAWAHEQLSRIERN